MLKADDIANITEGTSDILVFKNKDNSKGPGARDKLPFYNPSMELNRDLSVVFCQWLIDNSKNRVRLLDGLAASGIRGVRFLNELVGDFEVFINDWDSAAFDLIQKNVKKYNDENLTVLNKNLNTVLSEGKFHYVDIDPFGSPVCFVDMAVQSVVNGGVIACTATDTATLCGVYPKVCHRRYGAVPFHSVVMKEIGLRILLGFICREAGRYDKGIEPLVCYSTDHYFRVYVRIRNGVNNANDSMKNLKFIRSGEKVSFEQVNRDVGPLWMGEIQNKKVMKELRTILFEKKLGAKNEVWKLLDLLEEEADSSVFYYTTDSLASYLKTSPPKYMRLMDSLDKMGYDASRTHFNPVGFKTDAPLDVIEKVFKQK